MGDITPILGDVITRSQTTIVRHLDHTATQQKLVAKLYCVSRSIDALHSFAQEYSCYTKMQNLQGSCVPKVMEVGSAWDEHVGCMILSHTGEPKSDLANCTLAEASAARVALAAVHGAGVIHNDLRASNVLFRDSGGKVEASLIDFETATFHMCQAELKDTIDREVELLDTMLRSKG